MQISTMGRKKSKDVKEENKGCNVRKKKDLPPCRVCDAPAAGFHYGVNTCEACKGFFHRSLRFYKQYICEKNSTCLIQYGQKKMCQKCRHEKCLSVGMAKDAIKTGRYTTSKHTNDTLELKRLKFIENIERRSKSQGIFLRALVDCMGPEILKNDDEPGSEMKTDSDLEGCCNQDGISFRCFNNLRSCPTIRLLQRQVGGSCSWFLQLFTTISIQYEPLCLEGCSESELGKKERNRILLRCSKLPVPREEGSTDLLFSPSVQHSDSGSSSTSSKAHNQSASCSTSCLHSPASQSSSISSPESLYNSCLTHEQDTSPSTSHSQSHRDNCCSHDVTSGSIDSPCHSSCEPELSVHGIEELYKDKDQVVVILKNAYQRHLESKFNFMPKEELEKKAIEHMEMCRLKREMFGCRSRIPDSEYDLIFASTGIDFDNRLPRFNSYIQATERMISDSVKFAKAIPGFSCLPISVKINLIKYSAPDIVTLDVYRNICVNQRVSYSTDGSFYCIDDMVLIHHQKCHNDVDRFFSAHMRMAKSLQDFRFTLEEEIFLRAIFIMMPDRELWSPGDLASCIYEQLHACLLHLLEKRLDNTMRLYSKFIDLLVDMRLYNYNLTTFCKGISLHKYSRLLENPMLRIMMGDILFDEEDLPGEQHEESEDLTGEQHEDSEYLTREQRKVSAKEAEEFSWI